MKSRLAFLLIALWTFLWGCSHLNKNTSAPLDTNPKPQLAESSPENTLPGPQSEMTVASAAFDEEITGETDSTSVLPNGENSIDEKFTKEETPSTSKKIQPALDQALELCQVSQEFWQKGELENAIDALDQAYSLILEVDTTDQPKLIQQKEDLRFMISKRILEIYASRNIVVNGNYNAIPLVLNKHVQDEINRFTTGPEKNFFIEAYKRSGKFRPQIVRALTEAGLPEELSWLPLIESGFKVKALSRSRALGLWQFIPSTGYKFGLKRDKFIDERMDPVKSTQAAIDYLKELHAIFGDWSTVLAAYNCGEGRVLKVIRNQNINYLDNFWDLYERLPRETARYVPRFLATLHILNQPEKYGLDLIDVDPPMEYETITIAKQIHLKNTAKAIGLPEKELEVLNPELRYKILPNESYLLKIPPGNEEQLLAALDQIPISAPPQRSFVYHRVRRGETLSSIARTYRSSVHSIMRANNLRRSNYIVVGKLLKIPRRGRIYPSTQAPKPEDGRAQIHIVKKGDSLWNIAKQHGTTTKEIQELNNLKTTRLYKGQVLRISAGPNSPAPQVGSLDTYRVKPGDSPFRIALEHNMALERLLFLNKLWPGTTIYPGQQLYVE
ncbi:MAG: LysM peptidoglycan-binding domain-containing protein [Desulfobacterales bacterium]|nr:MAG: LysM peptidoglycan-binding domain-containing protein [Desulfobacterales bacterium]